MPSALQKLSEDLIVYSVLLADHERLDFKNDALAGVRANYFNSGGAPQSEETEMTLDGRRLRFRYEMKKDAPLAWKISGGNQPVQTVLLLRPRLHRRRSRPEALLLRPRAYMAEDRVLRQRRRKRAQRRCVALSRGRAPCPPRRKTRLGRLEDGRKAVSLEVPPKPLLRRADVFQHRHAVVRRPLRAG